MTERDEREARSSPVEPSLAQPERLQRVTVPELDQILGEPFRVLDQGFVRLVDYMGSDASIVQAARVSYGAGTRRINEDRGLIRYLMRHAHTTPSEMGELKLHVRVPMDTWRQWIRHRTANVNEYSTRYSVAIDAAQRTIPSEWRLQSPLNRQGSSGLVEPSSSERLSRQEADLHEESRRVYEERLRVGVAREQARKDLPLSTYTEAYWKIDLHNLFHFLKLRLALGAQLEIRRYAAVIGDEIVARWVPLAWEAFRDYRLEGLVLSAADIAVISKVTAGELQQATSEAEARGMLSWREARVAPNRERSELESKLRRIGLPIPWEHKL